MKPNDHNKQLYRDMQEAPDKYSDQEIEAMMDDLDQVPDVDEAWQQFGSWCLALPLQPFTLSVNIRKRKSHKRQTLWRKQILHSSLLILHSQPIPLPSSLDLSFSTMSHSIASLRTLLPIITLIWIFRRFSE